MWVTYPFRLISKRDTGPPVDGIVRKRSEPFPRDRHPCRDPHKHTHQNVLEETIRVTKVNVYTCDPESLQFTENVSVCQLVDPKFGV